MSNIQRKRLSSGKNLVEEMLANQETPMQLILTEESEAASTVVVPSSTPKKKVIRKKRAAEKEKKEREKERERLKMLSDARKENLKVGFYFDNLSGYTYKEKAKTFCKFCQTVSSRS